jgi:hypothetical protein
MDANIVKKESKIKSILWIALGDILQEVQISNDAKPM